MKKFIKEFKEFAIRGNVIDMAVGVVIGASFKGIVDSLVKDVISPFLGIVANKDFSEKVLMIGEVAVKYGSFLTAVINFILMSLVIFVMVKAISFARNLGKKEEDIPAEAPTVKTCSFCMSEIHIDAKRCPHCTSVLEDAAQSEL